MNGIHAPSDRQLDCLQFLLSQTKPPWASLHMCSYAYLRDFFHDISWGTGLLSHGFKLLSQQFKLLLKPVWRLKCALAMLESSCYPTSLHLAFTDIHFISLMGVNMYHINFFLFLDHKWSSKNFCIGRSDFFLSQLLISPHFLFFKKNSLLTYRSSLYILDVLF